MGGWGGEGGGGVDGAELLVVFWGADSSARLSEMFPLAVIVSCGGYLQLGEEQSAVRHQSGQVKGKNNCQNSHSRAQLCLRDLYWVVAPGPFGSQTGLFLGFPRL